MKSEDYYNVHIYIAVAQDLPYSRILEYGTAEYGRAEFVLSLLSADNEAKKFIVSYYIFLLQATTYFETKVRPVGMEHDHFMALRPIVHALVERGEWPADRLSDFV